ncbi:MAG TPA: histidinol-phosphate transaminase, partial [Clostridia bacterium]|nr:histidinol-phosphate transaminase [Clostridia bacterium]
MVNYRNTINRLNPYIPGKPISDVQRELGLERVVKLASNENPLGNSPAATKAVQDWTNNMAIYPDGNSTELKNAVANKLGINTDQLLFGNGTDQVLEIIAQTYINPGENSVTGSPSFSRYKTVIEVMDGEAIEVPLTGDHVFDLDALLASINDKTKIIWLCNPNNPTGTIITEAEQRAFIEKVPKDVLVVLDEAYYEYAVGDNYPDSIKLLDEFDNLLILRTFSKAYGLAGLRIGYAISSTDIINYLNRVRGPFNTNAAAQVAAIASIDDEDFVKESMEINEQGKNYLYSSFKKLGLQYIPTHANFMMVRIGKPSSEVFQELLKKGVIIRSGDIFGMDEWIRVTIGTMEENEIFIEALKEVI